MVSHQLVHDDVGAGAAVVDVPHDMEMIHHQTLDQMAQGGDELLGPTHPDDGLDDRVIIGFFIDPLLLFHHQLLDHVGKFRGQGLADLGAGIFACGALADLDQAIQGDLVPVLAVLVLLGLYHRVLWPDRRPGSRYAQCARQVFLCGGVSAAGRMQAYCEPSGLYHLRAVCATVLSPSL